jgi:O-antigen/teichoic acid export membrane protein
VPSPSIASTQNVLVAAKGGGITFVGALVTYALRLVLGVVLARLLGSEQFGLYRLAASAAAIVGGLVLLGLPSAMVRYVALYNSRRDAERIWRTLQVGIGAFAILGVLMAAGLYVLAEPIAERLFHEPRLTPLLRLLCPIVPLVAMNDIVAAATRGFKKMQYSAFGNVVRPLIKLILVVVLAIAIAGLNATEALVVHMVATAVVSVVLLYSLNKLFSLKRPLRITWPHTKKILVYALPLYARKLIGTFRGNIQTVLLGALNSVATVGVFSVAHSVNRLGRMFNASIAIASTPIISELYGRREWKQLGHLYQTATRWTFTLNLPLFLILLLFSEQILSIFGRSFVDGAAALSILAWGNLVRTGAGIGGVIINMAGRTRLKAVNTFVTSTLTVGLNALFIPRWGMVGAAVAALVVSVVRALLSLVETFILFRLLPYNAIFFKPVTAGLAALVTALGLNWLLPPEKSLVYAAVNAAMLLVVYVGVILLLGISDEDHIVLARLRGRVGAILSRG